MELIPGIEFSKVDLSKNDPKEIENCLRDSTEDEPEKLGLHLRPDGDIFASYWVGLVWLDPEKRLAARISSRWQNDEKPMELFLLEECLRFPEVAERIWGRRGIEAQDEEKIFHFWPEQPSLKVKRKDAFSGHLFLIAQFLYELKKLCERHLRRQFPRIEGNLQGRVKGKILIRENLRVNTGRGRFDRTFCSFQTHSLDTRENQILKAALEVSKAYLATRGFRIPVLWTMARFCSASFTEVRLRRVRPGDFVGLRLSSFMKPYQTPLELARIILTRIASEPDPSRWESKEVEVFPYAINMHQLFERYCEVLLRQKRIPDLEPNGLWTGDENLGSDFKVRPDFLIVKGGEGIVADAKYKPDWPSKYKDEYRGDVYQVVAYTQHKEVRKKLKELKARQDNIKQIWIFYPAENENSKYRIKDFEPVIIAYPISVEKKVKNSHL